MGENVDAVQHSVARIDREFNFLGRHLSIPFCLISTRGGPVGRTPKVTMFSQPLHDVLRTRIWNAQSGGLLPALVLGLGFDQHAHDVALLHYEVLDTIDFDLGARPLAEQDAVADFDVDRDQLAAFVAAAGSNGDDLALLRPVLGGIGNNYATRGLRLGIDSLDDNPVVKRSEFHGCPPKVSSKS